MVLDMAHDMADIGTTAPRSNAPAPEKLSPDKLAPEKLV